MSNQLWFKELLFQKTRSYRWVSPMMAMSPPYSTESTHVQCGVMQSQKCVHRRQNYFSPATAGHNFHHILLKCKNKCRQFLNSSSLRTAFSKICMRVRFILMLEVYIKIVWVTNTLPMSLASLKGQQAFRQGHITSRFPSPRRWIQWRGKHCLEDHLHSQYLH